MVRIEPVFGREGNVVGWLHEVEVLIDTARRCRAFIRGDWVLSYAGGCLGGFRNGFLWDCEGGAVGFVRGAFCGPQKPVAKLAPLAPVVRVPPHKPFVPEMPGRPPWSRAWSQRSFDAFLGSSAAGSGAGRA